MLEKLIEITPYGKEIIPSLILFLMCWWMKFKFDKLLTDKYADLKEEKYD